MSNARGSTEPVGQAARGLLTRIGDVLKRGSSNTGRFVKNLFNQMTGRTGGSTKPQKNKAPKTGQTPGRLSNTQRSFKPKE